MKKALTTAASVLWASMLFSQLVINEGSNRNFSTILDENEEAGDWIELYNPGPNAINLNGWSLSDDVSLQDQWTFSNYTLESGQFLLIFCSGKDRYFSNPFVDVLYETEFTPTTGWNEHEFDTPYYWDGTSDLIVNTCSYSNSGYITNSSFFQTETSYISTVVNYQDGSDASCSANAGETHYRKPNIRLNDNAVGNGTSTNGLTDYPAPYGNWYWGARNQSLYTAEELQAAGLTAGWIDELAYNVNFTEQVTYTYFTVSLRSVTLDELTNQFIGNEGAFFHTSFKLDSEGETVYLWSPDNQLVDEMTFDCPTFNISQGLVSDGNGAQVLFANPTPGYSNEGGSPAAGVAFPPQFSLNSGVYPTVQTASIFDINLEPGVIRYTLNGSDPDENSPIFSGLPLQIFMSSVLRARVFVDGMIPSEIATASYLINVSHSTPIISVATDNENLYGDQGIFDNWWEDWERYAQMAYFDSVPGHPLMFERQAGMQIDGGAGGSRSHPQHSFRLEMAKGSLGENPVNLSLLPQREYRDQYSKVYLRNGSNQYLAIPYKDAVLTEITAGSTNGYYSAMRPVSVYINGQYFGLYEMREKFDEEYYEFENDFEEAPDAEMDILSVSYWYGGSLRAVRGDAQHYIDDLSAAQALDPSSSNYLEEVGQYFDMDYYTDYIIGQTWVTNYDWPYNNIKIHRSEGTGFRWRFATIDLELSLQPNGWSDCYSNGLEHAFGQGDGHPFTGIWSRSMQNENYRNYFINRYADLLNTAYHPDRMLAIENTFFNRFVLEMPNEFARWADPWNVQGWMDSFITNHEILQDELQCKSDIIRDQVEDILDLDGQFNLELAVVPAEAGMIRVNTIVPSAYPWSGVYFTGVDIELAAIPNENYAFSHWESNGLVVDLEDSLWTGAVNNSAAIFTAVFETTIDISEVEKPSLRLHPNPVSSEFELSGDLRGVDRVVVVDCSGREVREIVDLGSNRFDVRGLEEGVYLVVVIGEGGETEVLRFVKVGE